MADCTSDYKKNKTDNCSPAEIDHSDTQELSSDHVTDELSDKESGNGDHNVHEYRKNISTCDQIEETSIKSWNQNYKKYCLQRHITIYYTRLLNYS